MGRLYPRILSNIPVTVDAKLLKTDGVFSNLSVDGAFLGIPKSSDITERLPGDTVLLKYALPQGEVIEHPGKITRKDRSGLGLKFYDLDAASRIKLWSYIADSLTHINECPYCGKEYDEMPKICDSCGWDLNFNSPEYIEYHRKQSLLKRLYFEASNLMPDQLQRIVNFMDAEILKTGTKEGFQAFVGSSAAMLDVFAKIRKVAPTDLPVLVLGESGTGKELTAIAIHERSLRKDKSFIAINCAAIPEGLLEAELFGYERGSFTGAHNNKKGKFEHADGGTIFLDEIGDMPPGLQAKLLRFLQDKIVERIGAIGGKRVDVRLIAATNRDLVSLIAEGRFRNDLYYRLNTFSISLPPIRERGEDKVILARYFLNKFVLEIGAAKSFDNDAVEAIKAYHWPGNVREIINKIRRAIVMSDGNSITPHDLDISGHDIVCASVDVSLRNVKENIEKKKIKEALDACGHNISQAAKVLGISRAGLYNYKKKYGL